MRWLLLLLLALAGASEVKAPVPIPAEPAFRLVQGVVLGTDGQPATGRTVHLIGLTRGSTRPNADANPLPNWDFVTDGAGRFTVRLGDFAPWEDPQQRPGWGGYGLVVDPGPNDAGAVGLLLLFDGDGRRGNLDDTEWGSALPVLPGKTDVTLRVQSGFEFCGKVWDAANPGQPLAGILVVVNLDLHSESHTGHGGEILEQQATTAADGTFVIPHVYPNVFWVGVGAANGFRQLFDGNEGYWLKTKVNGGWLDDVLDKVTPEGGKAPPLEMMAARGATFAYAGKVADAQGKPVARARVTFFLSFHPIPQTFEDDHSFPNGTTNDDGTFRILLPTPWARGCSVEAPGFIRYVEGPHQDDASLKPGTYDITLQRSR
jgi:hypothetical protein